MPLTPMASVSWMRKSSRRPRTVIDGDTERWNVCFAHYSGPPACLNLAWPLLVFGASGKFARVRRIVPVTIVAAALPLWDSAAGKMIGLALLLAGAIWRWSETRGWLTPGRIGAVAGIAVLALLCGQWFTISQMRSRTPDGWISADFSLVHATADDARLRALAGQRGDHLVPSTAPVRPSGWLCALRMAADYPLIGPGPGAWVKRSALYTKDTVVSTFFHYRQYAHHDLLQFAAEWGVLAALVALHLWLGGLWKAMQRRPAEIGIVLSLVGVAFHSTVDFPLQNPALQIWTALLLGLTWSRTKNP